MDSHNVDSAERIINSDEVEYLSHNEIEIENNKLEFYLIILKILKKNVFMILVIMVIFLIMDICVEILILNLLILLYALVIINFIC